MSNNNHVAEVSAPTSSGLVLASGSKAGLMAPLSVGYYAIGRDGECQIRPKSRSVSRFHCLISFSDDVMRVMDLDSTSGTIVAGRRLEPKKWVCLRHGDRINCGKIAFDVSLASKLAGSAQDLGGNSVAPANEDSTSIAADRTLPTGAALCEDDIADFLTMADADDRKIRYEQIISDQRDAERREDIAAEQFQTGLSICADTTDVSESANPTPANGSATKTAEFARPRSRPAKIDRSASNRPSSKPGKMNRSKTLKVKPKPTAGPRPSMPLATIGITVLLVAAFGSLGWQIYRQFVSPNVRVVRGIDG